MTTSTQNKGFLYTFSKRSFNRQGNNEPNNPTPKKQGIIQILVADDHPYLLNGVEADLNKDPRIKIISTAENYKDLLEKNKQFQPEIVVMDLKMPGKDDFELGDFISQIRSANNCRVIVFSSETGWARVHRCLELGASAFVEKAISTGKLAEFIHHVHDEDEILIYTAEQLPQIQFSPRQKEILHHMMDGKENDQISKCLNIEVKTVQSYVNEIKVKLSEAFGIHPIRPRTLMLLASKLGFGHKIS